MDRHYTVEWSASKITVHASSEKEALGIAIEYIQALEKKVLVITPVELSDQSPKQ